MLHSLKKDFLACLVITGIACAAIITFIFLRHQIYYASKQNVAVARASALLAASSIRHALACNQSLAIEAVFYDALSELNDNGLPVQALLYTHDGTVIASSTSDALAQQATSEELDYLGQIAVLPFYQTVLRVDKKTRIVHVYCPVSSGGTKTYIMRLDTAFDNMLSAIKKAYVLIICVFAVLGFAVFWLGMFFYKRVATPIVLLNTAAKEISEGDYGLRVNIQSMDEISELADAINAAASALQKNTLKKQ
jgi:methyl-accepting chemotaxis protein